MSTHFPRSRRLRVRVGAGVVLTAVVVLLGSVVSPGGPRTVRVVTATAPAAPVSPTVSATAVPVVPLVAWHGPVEHLFFHPLVLHPELAFTRDRLGRGFQDYFVTATEFRGIVEGLWRNGWTLVDAHRAARDEVRVPAGRTPLVVSEDDVNYYAYFAGCGLASRLVLDGQGEVRAEVDDGSGTHLTSDDLVPIVDDAVARHPELSADGAKGVLALTGYEGLLGEHDVASDIAARERVRALATRLRATGWTFASHTYGHITLTRASVSTLLRDTMRWSALVGDLLGPVDLLVYPFGSRPSATGRRLLRDHGFSIQFDIDIIARSIHQDGVTVMSRRHVDGLAFQVPGRLAPFFSVARIRDPARPT